MPEEVKVEEITPEPKKEVFRNVMPNAKQIRAVQLMNMGYTKGQAMRRAGYSDSYARTSSFKKKQVIQTLMQATRSEVLNIGLTPKHMSGKLKEWVDAKKEGKYGEEPDYETQIKAYDRWKDIMDEDGQKKMTKGVTRKMTIEEYIS